MPPVTKEPLKYSTTTTSHVINPLTSTTGAMKCTTYEATGLGI